jgi:DNA ligase D-like protein (predicted 3'-phosphoesterase)
MANKQDPLGTYRDKRDLERTTEPPADGKRRGGRRPRFVVHKHDATTLHYDFRLEAAGVLKSWAVRKGPSTNPSTNAWRCRPRTTRWTTPTTRG